MPGAFVWKKFAEGGLWVRRISLYGSSVRETWRGGSCAGDPVGYERKALGTGISLHGGSGGKPGMGSSTGDFERWLKGALEVGRLSIGAL